MLQKEKAHGHTGSVQHEPGRKKELLIASLPNHTEFVNVKMQPM